MSNLITLQIEGVASEDGHVLVPAFIERLEHLLSTLNGIDRIVGQTAQPTLNYRIVDARHSSPLTFTLEPILKKRISRPDPDHIQLRHRRFFREMSAVRRSEPVSPEIDDTILEHMRALVEGLGKEFRSARISNGESNVELDEKFEASVRRLLNEEDASYGSERGMLEALNIHGGNRTCWIYPKAGPLRIRCDFLPGTRDLIIQHSGKAVWVEGVKYFRPNSPFPFRIAVKDFGAMSDEESVPVRDLEGIAPLAIGSMSAVEFVRKIRDEWD